MLFNFAPCSHWLAKKVDELKNRRWRRVPEALYGRLSPDEVEKIKTGNPAFWECFMEKKPPEEVLRKKQAQYDRKTSQVKNARIAGPKEEGASDSKLPDGSPKSPKLSKKTRLVSRANAAAASRADTFTEIKDPTNIEMLEEIVQGNPVLTRIRECGVKAKREDVYPTSTTLQAGTCHYLSNPNEMAFWHKLTCSRFLLVPCRRVCLYVP